MANYDSSVTRPPDVYGTRAIKANEIRVFDLIRKPWEWEVKSRGDLDVIHVKVRKEPLNGNCTNSSAVKRCYNMGAIWSRDCESQAVSLASITNGSSKRTTLTKNGIVDSPNYFTLSYTWGKTHSNGSHLSHTIFADGLPLRVTSNLYYALRSIREIFDRSYQKGSEELDTPSSMNNAVLLRYLKRIATKRPALWVDAVCINQGDHREQAQQVRIMDQIYKNSSHLLVWLGYDFAKFGSYFHPHLSEIVKSPWFNRRWVIQESVLKHDSTSIISGATLVARVDFAQAIQNYRPNTSISLLNTVSSALPQYDLLQNLHFYSPAQCSDARDRIYALLSISSDGHCIEIDYNEDVFTVYLNAAKHFATSGSVAPLLLHSIKFKHILQKPPHVLHQKSNIQHTRPDASRAWPTWVPDWRSPARLDTELRKKYLLSIFHHADNANRHPELSELNCDEPSLVDFGGITDTYASVRPIGNPPQQALSIPVRPIRKCLQAKPTPCGPFSWAKCEVCRVLPTGWHAEGILCLIQDSPHVFHLSLHSDGYLYESIREKAHHYNRISYWSASARWVDGKPFHCYFHVPTKKEVLKPIDQACEGMQVVTII